MRSDETIGVLLEGLEDRVESLESAVMSAPDPSLLQAVLSVPPIDAMPAMVSSLVRAGTLGTRPDPFHISSSLPPIAAWQSDADIATPPTLPPADVIVRLIESWIGRSPHGVALDLAMITRDVHARTIDTALGHLLIGAALSYDPPLADVALCPDSAGRHIAYGQALLLGRRLDDSLAMAQALVVLRGLRTVGLAPGSSLALSIVASISARWCIAALGSVGQGASLERELATNALWLSLICAEWHSFAYEGETEHRRAMFEDVVLPAMTLMGDGGDEERVYRQRQFAEACLVLRTLVFTEHGGRDEADSIPATICRIVKGASAALSSRADSSSSRSDPAGRGDDRAVGGRDAVGGRLVRGARPRSSASDTSSRADVDRRRASDPARPRRDRVGACGAR